MQEEIRKLNTYKVNGGGKALSVRQIARQQLVADMMTQYSHNDFCSYFFLQKYNFSVKSARKSSEKFEKSTFLHFYILQS